MVAHMATHIEISGRPTCPDSMHFLYHFFLFLFFSPTIQSIQKYFLLYNLTITTLEQNHHLLSLNCHDSLLICLPTIISVSLLFICHMEARLFFIWIIFFPSKNHLLASSHTPNSAKASNGLHDLWSSLSPTLCLFNGLCALCLVAQSCPTLCDPLNYRPPGSFVHGDSPGKNTGAGCHALLQGIFPTQESNWDLMHCSWDTREAPWMEYTGTS